MYYDDDGGAGALLAFLFILLPLVLLFTLAGYVIGSFFLMRIFDKAGVQGKWRAWVPVYNLLVFAKLGDLSPWVMLGAILASVVLGQIPVLGWILSLAPLAAMLLAGWRVGQKLGHDWYLLLLWLIPGVGTLVWLGILALGQSRWNPAIGPAPWSGSGFLADRTSWDGIPAQPVGATSAAANPGGYAPATDGGYTPATGAGHTPPPPAAPQPPTAPPPPSSASPEPPAPSDPPPPRV